MGKKKDGSREIPITFADGTPKETDESDDQVLESEQTASNSSDEQVSASAEDPSSASAAAPNSADDPPVKADNQSASQGAGRSNLQSQVDTLTQEKAALYDQLLRRQAEFENFRRRAERERADLYQKSRADVLLELLPVLDNLERALASLETSAGDANAMRHGVELIHKQLKDTLTRLGLQPVESVGQTFDPHLHEAVTIEPSNEHEENTVIEEFQRGYKLGDRLLRPAKVKVASSPER